MARRDISIKKRGTKTKKERVTYLVVAEGKNKTETLYLSHFQEQGKEYYLRFVKAGTRTDAESLYKTLVSKWKEMGLSAASGDKGFVVLDIDNDKQKAEKVMGLIRKNKTSGITFVVSNPVFEVWLLLHFRFTTKFYADGDAVIKDLKKYISNYAKSMDYFDVCGDKLQDAISNAKKLAVHFEEKRWPSVDCNPRTDVGDLMSILR